MDTKNEAASPLQANRTIKKILHKISQILQQTIEFDALNLVLFVLWLLTVLITIV